MDSGTLLVQILFGSIGCGAFLYGRKQSSVRVMGIGIALLVYPYFVSNTVLATIIGVLLTAALFFFRG